MAYVPSRSCSNPDCPCKTAGPICPEFMTYRDERECARCGWEVEDHQLFPVHHWEDEEVDGKLYRRPVGLRYRPEHVPSSEAWDYPLHSIKVMAETVADVIGGSSEHGLAMAVAVRLHATGVGPHVLAGLAGYDAEVHRREAAEKHD